LFNADVGRRRTKSKKRIKATRRKAKASSVTVIETLTIHIEQSFQIGESPTEKKSFRWWQGPGYAVATLALTIASFLLPFFQRSVPQTVHEHGRRPPLTVTIINPAPNSTFTAGDDITVRAVVEDSGGATLKDVSFFADGQLIGTTGTKDDIVQMHWKS